MSSGDDLLAERIRNALTESSTPLRAREIAQRLTRPEKYVSRKHVNSVLYGELKPFVEGNGRGEWTLLATDDVVCSNASVAATENTPTSGRRWTQDEARVLVAIYYRNEFAIGDDSREECHSIAGALERSSSSVDRQWRNIASVCRGDTNKVGAVIIAAVHWYNVDPARGHSYALSLCDKHDWDLRTLIAVDQGNQSGSS